MTHEDEGKKQTLAIYETSIWGSNVIMHCRFGGESDHGKTQYPERPLGGTVRSQHRQNALSRPGFYVHVCRCLWVYQNQLT